MKQLVEFFTPYRLWLNSEFEIRKEKNASYSIRAFARDLGVSKTCIADVLNCRRHLSLTSAKKIGEKLQMSPLTREAFTRDLEQFFKSVRDEKREPNGEAAFAE